MDKWSLLIRKTFKGDIVDWDKAIFELENMTAEEQNMDQLCIPIRPGHVAFPMKRNFTSHVAMCNKLKGVASVVRDNETMMQMEETMNKFPVCGNGVRENFFSKICYFLHKSKIRHFGEK